MRYASDRVQGHADTHTLHILLSGPNPPNGLACIDLQVAVAGREYTQSFPPAPNQSSTFIWDRKEAYGRTVL